jgi:hypothetical protein
MKLILALFPGLAAGISAKAAPKPVVPRKHVIDLFYVAGFQYHDGAERGDFRLKDPVRLVWEPDNLYDERAVRVEWKGLHIGYAPRYQNRILSRMLDRRAPLRAHIAKINRDEPTWRRIKIQVDLEEQADAA